MHELVWIKLNESKCTVKQWNLPHLKFKWGTVGISFNFQEAITRKISFRSPLLKKNSDLYFVVDLPSVNVTAFVPRRLTNQCKRFIQYHISSVYMNSATCFARVLRHKIFPYVRHNNMQQRDLIFWTENFEIRFFYIITSTMKNDQSMDCIQECGSNTSFTQYPQS